jgi:hypothetical protein
MLISPDCSGTEVERKAGKWKPKKPKPFASNNKKCYTFVFQIF